MAVTRLYPRPEAQLICEWEDKEDFLDSLLTSCHIPLYFDRSRMATRFRGGWYCDGGFTQARSGAAAPPLLSSHY